MTTRVIPAKLQPGDEVRIIAPSRSMAIINEETRRIAAERFEALGLKVSFGAHVEECDAFASSSIQSRVDDLHDAFRDPHVKGIITIIGGFSANQMLPYIDWDIIRDNPKILCGYSDITILCDAIYAKTGLVTYYGPHYSTFGMRDYFDYNLDYFTRCLFGDEPIDIQPSDQWTDDVWYSNQDARTSMANEGWIVINPGETSGTIMGGNLNTLGLLRGTEWMPSIDHTILFIEDDSESRDVLFDRDLAALTQQPGFETVRGLVIGRFQQDSQISHDTLRAIIANNPMLHDIPVIANVDFGHTNPMITFPIGGDATLRASDDDSSLVITTH